MKDREGSRIYRPPSFVVKEMITSTSNQQMKKLSLLMKKAKERRQQGLFVVEGVKMFREAPRDWIVSVYVSEEFETVPEHRSLLSDIPYEIVADSVFRAVSDTQTPQGILAVVKMPHYTLDDVLRTDETHLLILESVQDPGNLGTMVRTGEGAGITGVIMNRTTVDLFNPKTIRSTMGSIYRVPFVVTDDFGQTLQLLRDKGVKLYAAHLKGEQPYDAFDYTGATGFMIGNEGNGLSDEAADAADSYIRIPMEGQVESLNAAISASLLMYECNRQRRKKHEDLV